MILTADASSIWQWVPVALELAIVSPSLYHFSLKAQANCSHLSEPINSTLLHLASNGQAWRGELAMLVLTGKACCGSWPCLCWLGIGLSCY